MSKYLNDKMFEEVILWDKTVAVICKCITVSPYIEILPVYNCVSLHRNIAGV